MRFLLCHESKDIILTKGESGCFVNQLSCPLTFSGCDTTKDSLNSLKKLDSRFNDCYSRNATEYAQWLGKSGLGHVSLTIGLNENSRRLTTTVEARTLKDLKRLFNQDSVDVRVQFSEAKIHIRKTKSCVPQRIAGSGQVIYTKWMAIDWIPGNPTGICVDDAVEIQDVLKPYLKKFDDFYDLKVTAKMSIEVSVTGSNETKWGSSSKGLAFREPDNLNY